MVLKITKLVPAAPVAQVVQQPAAPASVKQPAPPAAQKPKLAFLKRGDAAKQVLAQEEKKAELAKNQIYRFWLPNDKEAEITFLDGQLVDGILDIPFLYEHQVFMNNSWQNWFICTQDEAPCPVCEGGSQSSYVGMLTVINHTEYISKKDNKPKKDQVQLFVVKRDTLKQLQKKAAKNGGLRGCRFTVTRTGEKSANVGNEFELVKKYNEAELMAQFKEKAQPVNYEQYLSEMYIQAPALRKMGFGSTVAPVGSEAGVTENYSDQL